MVVSLSHNKSNKLFEILKQLTSRHRSLNVKAHGSETNAYRGASNVVQGTNTEGYIKVANVTYRHVRSDGHSGLVVSFESQVISLGYEVGKRNSTTSKKSTTYSLVCIMEREVHIPHRTERWTKKKRC